MAMKAVLFGTGWRSMFYIRIAKALPELLEIVSVCTRKSERAEMLNAEGMNAVTDSIKALSVPHDIVIVSSGPDGFFSLMKMLDERHETVLTETTFLSLSDRELDELSSMKGFVAEQYQYTPLFASAIASLDIIGNVDQLYLSGLHNHHAASIARIILGFSGCVPDEILSTSFPSRILCTGSRKGMTVNGGMENYERKIRALRFGDKLFINDFSSNQYASYLYGKHFEIRGDRGVITEREVRTVGDDGRPVVLPFIFHRDWTTGNGSLTLSHVTLGSRTLFSNPFYPASLNDDEIAIAEILRRMDSGEDCPTILSGIEDARTGRLL